VRQELIEATISNRVAVIMIKRPDKANSLPRHAKAELALAIEKGASDPDVNATVITGHGSRAFCAGSDIHEMRHFSMVQMDEMLAAERKMYLAALTSPKPVVAAVNGFALGAGLILAMTCDYTLAVPRAEFGAPELTIGVAAPLEGLLLPYLVGLGRARAMFYTGARIDAQAALSIGLINEIVEPENLLDRARAIAESMSGLPANGFAIQKHLLHRLVSTGNLTAVIEESHHLTSRQFASEGVGEAMDRFLSRKNPLPQADPSQALLFGLLGRSAGRLPADEQDWLRQEAEEVAVRSATLNGQSSWRPNQSHRGGPGGGPMGPRE